MLCDRSGCRAVKAVAWLRTEQARPRAIREHPRGHWLAVAAVCVGAFMGHLNASIVTVAYPAIRSDLRASLGAVEWVA